MAVDIDHLVRKNILALKGYVCARMEHWGENYEYMDANENALGSACSQAYNRYPDPYQSTVKEAISDLLNVSVESLFLGNGSDEAIDLVVRIFCEPKEDEILITPPTYGMYETCAALYGIGCIEVPLTQDFQINVAAVRAAADERTKIIFLCSPNNPTGNLLDLKDIKTILEVAPGMVVVDEAYIDFSESPGALPFTEEHNNLIVLRTFSKAWGLAGIRLGIAIAPPRVIDLMNKVKMPYNVSSPTQQYALEALANKGKRETMTANIKQQRASLAAALKALPFVEQVYPSDANFLLVRVKNHMEVITHLEKHSIIVRNRSSGVLCDRCIRITVGDEASNRKLINTLTAMKEQMNETNTVH